MTQVILQNCKIILNGTIQTCFVTGHSYKSMEQTVFSSSFYTISEHDSLQKLCMQLINVGLDLL